MSRHRIPFGAVLTALILMFGCSTAPPPISLKEPRRMLGTESDVRLDAQIFSEALEASQQIAIEYAITNNRRTAIAVAELIPTSSYDTETRTVTVTLGTEIPGQEFLPRLAVIGPGEKKTFSTSAHITIAANAAVPNPFRMPPNGIQLKLNFLSDTTPFTGLIGIPERAVHDPKLAATLFPKWLELNETLLTNTLPMRWSGSGQDLQDVTQPARRRPSRP